MSQIEFKDVSKVYPNGHVGLKDINLNIEKGDFCSYCWIVWSR